MSVVYIKPLYGLVVSAVILNPFNLSTIIGLIALVLLLFCSAMISGSEVAFFSLSPVQLKKLRLKHQRIDDLILHFLNIPKYLLATILISNNFVNVAIVVLSTFLSNEMFNTSQFPWLAFFIQLVFITALILFFGEIMPKIYAAQNAIIFARIMARPIKVLMKIFYPFSSMLVKSTAVIDKKIVGKGYQISRSELSEAIEITANGNSNENERKILQGIVKFGDIDVKEIMKSRTDVVAVEKNTNFKELQQLILNMAYSRIPVYLESFDNVDGILYIKDLLPYLDKRKDFKWQKLLRPAFFVPENKKINELLKEFQEKKVHMAIVVDEYGGTSGIVTLEDVLEEIVGEISDEFDSEEDEISYSKIDENNYVFKAKTTINDFCKILNIEDDIFNDIKGDADSLAGIILELQGKIPQKGEHIPIKNFIFTIEAVDKRRIKQIRVTIKPAKPQ